MDNTPQSFAEYYIFNNLFHSSMDSGTSKSPLDQCYFDSKSFQQNTDVYEDSLSALKKINNAFNQTIFMYNGHWHIVRMEELYIPITENLIGYKQTLLSRTYIDQRFDIEISKNSLVKQISPEMIRFINRRTKKDTVIFNYTQFDEVICNESFERGLLTIDSPFEKTYELDQWTRGTGQPTSPVTPTEGFYGRKQTFDSLYQLLDNYVFNETQYSYSDAVWLKSCDIGVLYFEKFDISFDFKLITTNTFLGTYGIYYVILDDGTDLYSLREDGSWLKREVGFQVQKINYGYGIGADKFDYQSISLTSNSIPVNGIINVYLVNPGATNTDCQFKNLKVNIINSFNGFENRNIKGVKSIFTKNIDVRNNFEDEIFFDDGFSKNYKGTIYEDDASTPTDKTWFRRRVSTETLGFRRQNDNTHWEHNRFNRNKIDCNFYGLTWGDPLYPEPIGLINTVNFIDDDPNKVYAIANLKEIDFSNSTWSATLVELWDDDKDTISPDIEYDFLADVTTGTYDDELLVPFTEITTGPGFSVENGNEIKYVGLLPITTNITCIIQGNIITSESVPVTTNIQLTQNGYSIKSVSVTISSNPQSFTIDLSPSTSTIISQDDVFVVNIGNKITSIQYTDGEFSFTFFGTAIPITDTYTDKFIYE